MNGLALLWYFLPRFPLLSTALKSRGPPFRRFLTLKPLQDTFFPFSAPRKASDAPIALSKVSFLPMIFDVQQLTKIWFGYEVPCRPLGYTLLIFFDLLSRDISGDCPA